MPHEEGTERAAYTNVRLAALIVVFHSHVRLAPKRGAILKKKHHHLGHRQQYSSRSALRRSGSKSFERHSRGTDVKKYSWGSLTDFTAVSPTFDKCRNECRKYFYTLLNIAVTSRRCCRPSVSCFSIRTCLNLKIVATTISYYQFWGWLPHRYPTNAKKALTIFLSIRPMVQKRSCPEDDQAPLPTSTGGIYRGVHK